MRWWLGGLEVGVEMRERNSGGRLGRGESQDEVAT